MHAQAAPGRRWPHRDRRVVAGFEPLDAVRVKHQLLLCWKCKMVQYDAGLGVIFQAPHVCLRGDALVSRLLANVTASDSLPLWAACCGTCAAASAARMLVPTCQYKLLHDRFMCITVCRCISALPHTPLDAPGVSPDASASLSLVGFLHIRLLCHITSWPDGPGNCLPDKG